MWTVFKKLGLVKSATASDTSVPGTGLSDDPKENEPSGEKEKRTTYGVKILYDPMSAMVDIVFVHGLTGGSYSTWLHKESGVCWPRDLLKANLNDARVLSFGYDADVVNFWSQAAQDGISGYANDLLGSLSGSREGVLVCAL